MKRKLTIVLLFTFAFCLFTLNAQSPDLMSYQAVIRDVSGDLVRNSQVGMRISIVQGTPDGTDVYVEEYTVTTNTNGLVSLEIGSGSQGSTSTVESLKNSQVATVNIVSGNFSDINWSDGPYFIKVETDPTGGANYTITGTSQLLSVPYAQYAESSGNVKFTDGDNSDDAVYIGGNVGIGTSEPQAPLHIKTNFVPALIISSSTTNDPSRPGIRFSNNTSQFISGDGLSDELFGFYSIWANKRTYDAKLRVYGKASASWGKYIEITHDGNNAHILTDIGDIEIVPEGETKIKNLATPVDAKDAVTKAYVDALKGQIEKLELLAGISTVTDIDGNSYSTIKIGNQVWMAENLKVTHYPDGTAIPLVIDNTAWANLGDNNTDDAYCFYDNNADLGYGALYSWAAAMGDNAVSSTANPSGVQGVCPTGWHLPSDAEWTELENYLIANGYNYDGTTSGNKIGKSLASTTRWRSSNVIGDVGNDQSSNNTSGFSALPGGLRDYYNGTFLDVGYYGDWWSSTESSSSYAYNRYLDNANANVGRSYLNKSNGFSARCVRD